MVPKTELIMLKIAVDPERSWGNRSFHDWSHIHPSAALSIRHMLCTFAECAYMYILFIDGDELGSIVEVVG